METLADASPTEDQETGRKVKMICHEDQGKKELKLNL